MIQLLTRECGLAATSVVADVGSGTGILSELFLKNGNVVFGIEPNVEMREAAERLLTGYTGFTSVAATAEDTALKDTSADFVTAGQAFHWFDLEKTRAEFARVLKPNGWVVLVWNSSRRNSSPFMEAYEQLVERYTTDYEPIEHRVRERSKEIDRFFSSGGWRLANFANRQPLNLVGLHGRLLSSSFLPSREDPISEKMLRETGKLFRDHESDGLVIIEYTTNVYYGRLPAFN